MLMLLNSIVVHRSRWGKDVQSKRGFVERKKWPKPCRIEQPIEHWQHTELPPSPPQPYYHFKTISSATARASASLFCLSWKHKQKLITCAIFLLLLLLFLTAVLYSKKERKKEFAANEQQKRLAFTLKQKRQKLRANSVRDARGRSAYGFMHAKINLITKFLLASGKRIRWQEIHCGSKDAKWVKK